jgi:hypothetical protein
MCMPYRPPAPSDKDNNTRQVTIGVAPRYVCTSNVRIGPSLSGGIGLAQPVGSECVTNRGGDAGLACLRRRRDDWPQVQGYVVILYMSPGTDIPLWPGERERETTIGVGGSVGEGGREEGGAEVHSLSVRTASLAIKSLFSKVLYSKNARSLP